MIGRAPFLKWVIMIVCLCNRISDKSVSEVACSGMCRTAGEVYRCFGCRVQCGKCVPEMRRLFHEARAVAQAAQMQAATLQDHTGCEAVCAAAALCGAIEAGGDDVDDSEAAA
ncbi:bacterioferritin-associated ferredoxin [Arboricoccus pini]|uniref:Bacterioferritin-associated ferredoxin n=1 Tax=Arboricoccus pini TaxID=1963835 RepID=A0A212QR53_9PROT|nr:(2Fe-2S)-binding protein [Arboricoccus pini]SNB62044.1 bacterioferritin-associated ferredoxin [Arboricoccus pini]